MLRAPLSAALFSGTSVGRASGWRGSFPCPQRRDPLLLLRIPAGLGHSFRQHLGTDSLPRSDWNHCPGWPEYALLVEPRAVLRWHGQGLTLVAMALSNSTVARTGSRLDVSSLIRSMYEENRRSAISTGLYNRQRSIRSRRSNSNWEHSQSFLVESPQDLLGTRRHRAACTHITPPRRSLASHDLPGRPQFLNRALGAEITHDSCFHRESILARYSL